MSNLGILKRLLRASTNGQALVEFGLTLPLLLVILLGVADLGRVFQAGIVMESAARAAAEAAALEYLRDCERDADGRCIPPSDPDKYTDLHLLAAQTACEEARVLTNTTYDATHRDCDAGTSGDQWPLVRVCIHDGADPACGNPISGYPHSHAACDGMTNPTWSNALGDHDLTGPYVEVRVCYRFTTLFNVTLPMATGITVGEVFLDKEAHFSVADY